jgi:hypothetical protein
MPWYVSLIRGGVPVAVGYLGATAAMYLLVWSLHTPITLAMLDSQLRFSAGWLLAFSLIGWQLKKRWP